VAPEAPLATSPLAGETATEVVFCVGYEAADVELARQMEPDDPVHFDELRISYYPAKGELDVSSWWRVQADHADWDVIDDGTSSTDVELLRRIAVCGEAVESLSGPHAPVEP
jgi:hypothetical protein